MAVAGAFWEGKKLWRVGREGKVWMEIVSSADPLLRIEQAPPPPLLVSDDDVAR